MHKSARQKIVRFIIDNDLFPELIENNYFDDDLDDDMLYGDLYLLKKQSLVYGLDLNKIKESHTLEEYKNNIKKEFLKIPSNHVKLDDWYWSRFYNKRGVLIDFINSLDIKDFDIHVPAFGWFEDKELHDYIDYSQIHDILSIYTTFYDDILSKKCNVDVIYNKFEHVNMIGHSARVDFMDLDGYSFQEGRYPQKFERKYDLIIMQLDYDDFNMMDKSFYYEIDDSNIAHFIGDKILYNISKMMHNLNDNGYAVIKLPYTFVSKLDNSIIDQNIIDKIVYLPCEDCVFSNEFAKIKMAYVIVKNNKSDFNIEFIDKLTKERCLVKNADIKTHKGVTNMHIYNRNNPMLEKIYRIKEDNAKQLDIISKESEFINKQIDELDFE